MVGRFMVGRDTVATGSRPLPDIVAPNAGSRPVVSMVTTGCTTNDGLRPFGSGRDPSLTWQRRVCDLLDPVATCHWCVFQTKNSITLVKTKFIKFCQRLHPRLYIFPSNYHCPGTSVQCEGCISFSTLQLIAHHHGHGSRRDPGHSIEDLGLRPRILS